MSERTDTERHSSQYWLQLYQSEHPGFEVMDPDGWDRRGGRFEASWNEKITRQEFDRRVMFSTCRCPRSMLSKPVDAEEEGDA